MRVTKAAPGKHRGTRPGGGTRCRAPDRTAPGALPAPGTATGPRQQPPAAPENAWE